MKKLLTLFFLAEMSTSLFAGEYRLNDAEIDTQFQQSESMNYMFSVGDQNGMYGFNMDMEMSSASAAAEKTQKTAAIIAFATVVVPWVLSVIGNVASNVTGVAAIGLTTWAINVVISIVPWHRLYLGTADNNLKIWALYCVTLRWCGALPIIDGIMLLMDDSGEKYMDNPKYVMWID